MKKYFQAIMKSARLKIRNPVHHQAKPDGGPDIL